MAFFWENIWRREKKRNKAIRVMTDMIFCPNSSNFMCCSLISSSTTISFFCRTLRQFWVCQSIGGHTEKKEEQKRKFTFVVVLLCCKVLWKVPTSPDFSAQRTMKQMTWTPILLSSTLVFWLVLLGDNGKLFHFNYAHLPTWRMTHLERIFPLQGS